MYIYKYVYISIYNIFIDNEIYIFSIYMYHIYIYI